MSYFYCNNGLKIPVRKTILIRKPPLNVSNREKVQINLAYKNCYINPALIQNQFKHYIAKIRAMIIVDYNTVAILTVMDPNIDGLIPN